MTQDSRCKDGGGFSDAELLRHFQEKEAYNFPKSEVDTTVPAYYPDAVTQIISHDTETELIGRLAITPDWICSGLAFLDPATGEITTDLYSELSDYSEGIHEALYDEDEDSIIVYHNFTFDGRVITRDSQTMMDLVWKKLSKGQIKDTLIREKLLNLTEYGDIDTPNGRRALYSQAALEKQYLNIDRSEEKKEGSARTTYNEVRHLPVEEWPAEYSEYAKDDPKYCLMIYMEQEIRRRECIERIGIDPFIQEDFRVSYSFALALMTDEGLPVDKERLKATNDLFKGLYNDPRLVNPLVESGILIPAVPALPHANGSKDHLITCCKHKDNPEYTTKKVNCNCPAKMKAPVKEKSSRKTLHGYVWALARTNNDVEVWLSDSAVDKLRESGELDDVTRKVSNEYIVNQAFLDAHVALPKGWLLKVDKGWMEQFSHMDDLIEIYASRKKLEKMITSYLPRMFYEDDNGELVPADTIHADYDCLKRTGRTSSRSSKLYPSWNGQQVDPRIRPCAVALPGHALVSIDYNAMELGTLAQTCMNLFGFSVLGDVINKGEDPHGFLGAQIAYELDPMFKILADCMREETTCESHEDRVWSDYEIFKSLKGAKDACDSEAFRPIYEKIYKKKDMDFTWGTFYAHYRTFAKPTGLGYPGGLGPKTFVQYARATYKVEVDLETATLLRDIWKATFPELAQYLDYISKESFDKNHDPVMQEDKDGKRKKRKFYSYDTPLGLHRAKTDFCACANGTGLQSPSAEGAGLGVIEIQRLVHTTNDTCLSRVGKAVQPVRPALFIHDEILAQVALDGRETERIEFMGEIMVRNMELITPDVKAGVEPAMCLRWDKQMDEVRDELGNLIPWIPYEDREAKELGE
jgi:hypothetical protein